MSKIATDLNQSKLLAKILPIESADMCYYPHYPISQVPKVLEYKLKDNDIPAWSLSALLALIPRYTLKISNTYKEQRVFVICDEHMIISGSYDEPIDACIDMIQKLHERKLL